MRRLHLKIGQSTLLLFIGLLFLSCNAWKTTTVFTYEELSASDFKKKLSSSQDYILVDVRTPKEYEKGHIANALNISYFGSEFKTSIEKLPKDKLVFMYCQTQHRSPLASKYMKKKGFTHIIDLSGGFMKWENNNMPIVK